MDPLITIEIVPISIEYVKKETKYTASQLASLRISRQEDKMTIKSNPINISLTDSFERNLAAKGHNLTYKATAQYSDKGRLSMNLFIERDDSASYRYEQVSRDIDTIINYVPLMQNNSSYDMGYDIDSMKINFDISRLSLGLPTAEFLDTSFFPPDIEIKVVERPKVIIKYVGGPIYIPKSADLNYIPPEDQNQFFDEKPNLDVKA
jgi:hypothetical protein